MAQAEMDQEISAAVLFLTRIIERRKHIPQPMIERFRERLAELLQSRIFSRFRGHWFPDRPSKGQGYRCIRLNENDPRDQTIERAAVDCGLKYRDLGLPVEMTLWVDPKEVCCRFGEHKGSYCTVASFTAPEKASPVPIESVVDKAVQELVESSELTFPPSSSPSPLPPTEAKAKAVNLEKENVEPRLNSNINVENSPKKRTPRKQPPTNRPAYPFTNRHPFQAYPNFGPSGFFGPKPRNFFGSYPPPPTWFPPMHSPPGAISPPPHFLYPGLTSSSYSRKRNSAHYSYNNRSWTNKTMVKA